MSRRHTFHPSELSSSTLEARIALSHGAHTAEVARADDDGLISGTIETTLPPRAEPGWFVLGGGYSAELAGTDFDFGHRWTHVTIHLSSNASLGPDYGITRGTMFVTSEGAFPGEMIIALHGPSSNLQTGTIPLTFTTETATGVFRAEEGTTGTYKLDITTTVEQDALVAKGEFTMLRTS
jgi:hypothetical protein